MKYITEALVVLLGTLFILSEAYYAEIPTDMRYPCYIGGHYRLPVDEPHFSDLRLKRQQKFSLTEKLENLKRICAANLGIPLEEVPDDLLNVENPSPKMKCLLTCILQRLQLMTKNNVISVRGIERLADEIGNHNPLVTSIAIALAQQFNDRLTAMQITDPCEAGYLINRYIAKEMKDRNLDLPY